MNGAVAPYTVVEFLSGFDLFVLPTHGENYERTVLEVWLPASRSSLAAIRRGNRSKRSTPWLVDSASPTGLARLTNRAIRRAHASGADQDGRIRSTPGT